MDPLLSQAEVKGRFHYYPETGIFTENTTGERAGRPGRGGYLEVRVGGRNVGLHRLAFMWMLGHWPAALVDHVNGDILDNRWGNLRPATATQNAQNRRVSDAVVKKGGYKGVSVDGNGRYRVWITVDGIRYKIPGSFDSASQAHRAYLDASARMFGQFERTVGAATVAPPDRKDETAKSAQREILMRRRAVVAQQLADIDKAIAALDGNEHRKGHRDQQTADAMRASERREEVASRLNQRLMAMGQLNKSYPVPQ